MQCLTVKTRCDVATHNSVRAKSSVSCLQKRSNLSSRYLLDVDGSTYTVSQKKPDPCDTLK